MKPALLMIIQIPLQVRQEALQNASFTPGVCGYMCPTRCSTVQYSTVQYSILHMLHQVQDSVHAPVLRVQGGVAQQGRRLRHHGDRGRGEPADGGGAPLPRAARPRHLHLFPHELDLPAHLRPHPPRRLRVQPCHRHQAAPQELRCQAQQSSGTSIPGGNGTEY